MKRLVAFGCSYTYGQGLPDCFVPPYEPGKKPSKFAWPAILADKLNIKCINKGLPGGSTLSTSHIIDSFNFEEGDIAVVLWPNKQRYSIINRSEDKEWYDNILPSKLSPNSIAYYKNIHSEYNSRHEQKVHVNYIIGKLNFLNIPVFITFVEQEYVDIESIVLDQNKKAVLRNVSFSYVNINFPKAADQNLEKGIVGHIGVEGQNFLAEQMYKGILKTNFI